VILMFSLTCFLVQFIVRLDYGPDEPYHLEYIHTLAAERRLPKGTETYEAHHPPVYYVTMATLWAAAGVEQRPLSITPGAGALHQISGRGKTARRILRFANTLLACGTLLVIARILLLIGVGTPWHGLIVLLIAACPMFQYVSSVVNNENLSILYSAVVCLALVSRNTRGSCSLRQAFLIGLLLGLTTWIKQPTLFAVPLALWTLWIAGQKRQRWARLGLFAVGAVAVGIWWPLYNYQQTGQLFADYAAPADQERATQRALGNPVIILEWMRISLETTFLPDWSSLFLPRWVSTLGGVVTLLLVVGLFAYGLRDRADPRRSRLRAMSFTGLLLLFIGLLQFTLFTDWRAHVGGRFLMNGAAWFATLLGTGLPWVVQKAEPQPSLAVEARALPLAIPLAVLLLLLASAGWWFLVRVYYLSFDEVPL
jgi:hypothetical protein